MNVLHVIPAIAPRYGGPSIAVTRMCAALGHRGIRTLVITSDADGPGRLSVDMDREMSYEGARVRFFRRRASESFTWTPALAAWVGANAGAFDVVHIHAVFSHACLAAGRAARAAQRPYIVRPLGSLDPWSLKRHALRKHAFLSTGGRQLLGAADAVHYTSEVERELAEKALPGLARGVVIPLGVDDALFQHRNPETTQSPYVLSLARFDPKKGFDQLIQAFHTLGGLEEWRLVLAGAGDPGYTSHLQTLAHAGPASDRIEFRGWVDGGDRIDLLQRAALFVLPSHQENFGISVVEALACGVPVVVSPGVNLAADIEAAAAGWVAPRAIEGLAPVLRAAMQDPVERARRGRNAGLFAAQFRWANVADQLVSLYESMRGQPAAVTRDRSREPAEAAGSDGQRAPARHV